MNATQVTVEGLKRAIGFGLLDPYSADAWAKQMRVAAGVRYEELDIGVESRASAACRLDHLETAMHRAAVLYVHAGGVSHDGLSWAQGLIERQCVLLSCGLGWSQGQDCALVDCVADIWRLVSYLSLRNDLVNPRRIYCCADERLAGGALCAAAIDDRIRGLLLEAPAAGDETLEEPLLSMATALVAPRPLAVLDCRPRPGKTASALAFVNVIDNTYRAAGRSDRLWLGKHDPLDRAEVLDRMLAC